MPQTLGHVALVVRDCDEAIAFYVGLLGFELARASTPEQLSRVGNQTGGRVFLFLYTDDLGRDHAALTSAGVRVVRPPSVESYGTVCVFEDLYGNLWDLIERPARS